MSTGPAAELPTAILLDAYRYTRGFLLAVEKLLVIRGAVKCAKCQVLHPPLDENLTYPRSAC